MQVRVHTAVLTSDGSTVPDTMDTGSAGLAANARVTPFSTPDGAVQAGSSVAVRWLVGGVGALLAAAGVLTTRRTRLRAVAAKSVGSRSGTPLR